MAAQLTGPSTQPLIDAWLASLRHQRRLAAPTLRNYAHAATRLTQLMAGAALSGLTAVQVRRFVARLHAQGLSPRALALELSAWRSLFRWLNRHHGLEHNPVLGVRAPKAARGLPKALSVEAAQQLLTESSLPDASPPDAALIRDRAMFELLYSSGLRRAELLALNVNDGRLDLQAGEITVTGKGQRSRTIPVGAPACTALRAWLGVREQLAAPDEPALFVGARGHRLHASALAVRLNAWARQRQLHHGVHPHVLRHSFASHVLQSSQDLRAVQELLGHASIATTQIYTHLDFQALAKVYDAAHPRAKRK